MAQSILAIDNWIGITAFVCGAAVVIPSLAALGLALFSVAEKVF